MLHLGYLPFQLGFNGLEFPPTVTVGWLALENGSVHSVRSNQLLYLVDAPTAS
jgi:hypothetical protein